MLIFQRITDIITAHLACKYYAISFSQKYIIKFMLPCLHIKEKFMFFSRAVINFLSSMYQRNEQQAGDLEFFMSCQLIQQVHCSLTRQSYNTRASSVIPHQGPVVNTYTYDEELKIECQFFFFMLSLGLKLMLIETPPGLVTRDTD